VSNTESPPGNTAPSFRKIPRVRNLQIAWFRLGECYLKVNQIDDAVTSFNFLIENFRTGPFVGSAAYRIAVLRLNARDYQNALTYFDVARKQLNDPKA
jgi:tetratricopeptide (TPR) repeat protein